MICCTIVAIAHETATVRPLDRYKKSRATLFTLALCSDPIIYLSLKIAEVSLSKWAYLVSR